MPNSEAFDPGKALDLAAGWMADGHKAQDIAVALMDMPRGDIWLLVTEAVARLHRYRQVVENLPSEAIGIVAKMAEAFIEQGRDDDLDEHERAECEAGAAALAAVNDWLNWG